tara:strand:+ start:455 stop:643 length:189 start_codon:yes stop_codon:yes gene_type:complete
VTWLRRLLGLSTPLEKKKRELSSFRHEAFYATRDGNLRRASELSEKAEKLEDEIVEMISEGR